MNILKHEGHSCLYGTNMGSCEHSALNFCLRDIGAHLLISTRLVVNWEGCTL